MTSKLTARQEKAAQLYVGGESKSDAYRKAGYSVDNMSDSTVNEESSRLFSNPKVSARVEELNKLALERQMVTIDRVVAEYAKLAFLDINDIFYPDGTMKPLNEMKPEARAAITDIEVVEQKVSEETFNTIKKVKLTDKRLALDSLAKYLEMFVTKHEHTGKGGKDLIPEKVFSREELLEMAKERGLPSVIFEK